MQKWLIPVNSCFAVLIVVILALISSDLISFRLGKVFPKGAPKAALPAPARASTEELAAYAPILEKGLFGKAGRTVSIDEMNAAIAVRGAEAR